MKTILYDRHVALGAKMIDFCGWEMPIQYQGIIQEHHNVREKVGLFDVSHMGRIVITGVDAEKFLDYISTNKIFGKPNFSATYTVCCDVSGGSVDDIIVYKEDTTHCFVIVNACNREKDLKHLQQQSKAFDVTVTDLYETEGILSIQGPLAQKVLSKFLKDIDTLAHMHFLTTSFEGHSFILSRTGYTGEKGYEIYAPLEAIPLLWDQLLFVGQLEGIMPIGLGARDTLRLEMGFALYGHELTDGIAPTESVSAWAVKFNKSDFIGKEALEKLEESPEMRSEHGIILTEPGIARAGYEVFRDNERIGYVTSGTYSPSLNQSIAIVLVDQTLNVGDRVDVQIRHQLCRAEVVKLPFYTIQG